jgi:aerobic-type carbon monoxide dehydrogenase small subunit (CoxS/CutS family)
VKRLVSLRINGTTHEVAVESHHTLLDALRREFKLFGTREACGIGMCGSCTVLMDGKPLSSCLLLAALVEGKSVTTIEGLADNGELHPVQQAFIDRSAFQCSYCTPGFILSVTALLQENPSPTAQEIKEYLAGNLCRCGSYVKIQEAVVDVAGAAGSARSGPA